MLPLWNFFIQKKQFTLLLICALIAAGIVALIAIPKESAPEVRIPIGIVSTALPGASAADVEQLVTNEIEDGISNLENLDSLSSSSREGISIITAEFSANADLDKSIQELKDAVDSVTPELPAEANDPIVSDVNFSEQPILMISVTGNYLPAELTNLGNDLKDELQGLPGVLRVDLAGVQEREVQVLVNSEKLDQYGVRLVDVVAAISSANISMPLGVLTIDDIDYTLTFEGGVEDPSEIGNIAIGTSSGAPVYVRDIALVSDGVERAQSYSRVSVDSNPSEPSLTLNVFKTSGGNIVSVADGVKERLAELQAAEVITGEVVIAFDMGEQVNKDLTELTEVGLTTMVLVMLSLFLTIGWRESVVAGLTIPLSFLIAFIGLYVSGNTINFISLFSLILAIGILVDSGIVVTEAIHARTQKYPTKEDAARAALREYAWPLIAGTMTTVAVFVPLFFISGIVGEFISSIPFTLIFVLIASIFVALGFVPLLAIMFTTIGAQNALEKRQEAYTARIQNWYRGFLSRMLDNRRFQKRFLIAMVAGFFIVMSLPFLGVIETVFFPPDEAEFIYLEIEMVEGTTLAQTDLATRAVEEILYQAPEIESFVTTIGAGSAFSQTSGSGSKLANITVLLKSSGEREKTSAEFSADLRAAVSEIPNATIRVFEPTQGPPTGAPILATFIGDDLDALARAVAQAEQVLGEIPGTTEITTSTGNSGTAFVLTVDKSKAAAAGVSPDLLARTLRTAVNGTTATSIKTNEEDIDVVVALELNPNHVDMSGANRATPETLLNLRIQTPSGSILLGSIASVDVVSSNTIITHEDGERTQTVSAYTTSETTPFEATRVFQTRMSELGLPEGVSMQIGGETEEIQRSFIEMGLAFVAGILLMLAILVLEFNSFRHTIYLLSVIPLSMIGVFLGLLLLQLSLSFTSLLGVIALAGVIINHSIILMDSMHRIHKEQPDLTHKNVVVEASVSRLRPIILTTITTVIGMIPLMGVSGLWSPLATAIMFGLAFSTILTLALIPILFFRWPGALPQK